MAQEWCRGRGWEFRVVTEQQIRSGFRLQNVKLLAQYARQKVDSAIRSQIFASLQEAKTAVSVQYLAQAIGSPVAASRFCLAYQHEINLTLDQALISEATIVSRSLRKEGGR